MFEPITIPFGAKMLFNTLRLKPGVKMDHTFRPGLRELAAELVRLKVDVIVSAGPIATASSISGTIQI